MPTYLLTAPDRSRWEVVAPDDATEAEVLAYAQQHWGAQQAPRASQGDVRRYEQQNAEIAARGDSMRAPERSAAARGVGMLGRGLDWISDKMRGAGPGVDLPYFGRTTIGDVANAVTLGDSGQALMDWSGEDVTERSGPSRPIRFGEGNQGLAGYVASMKVDPRVLDVAGAGALMAGAAKAAKPAQQALGRAITPELERLAHVVVPQALEPPGASLTARSAELNMLAKNTQNGDGRARAELMVRVANIVGKRLSGFNQEQKRDVIERVQSKLFGRGGGIARFDEKRGAFSTLLGKVTDNAFSDAKARWAADAEFSGKSVAFDDITLPELATSGYREGITAAQERLHAAIDQLTPYERELVQSVLDTTTTANKKKTVAWLQRAHPALIEKLKRLVGESPFDPAREIGAEGSSRKAPQFDVEDGPSRREVDVFGSRPQPWPAPEDRSTLFKGNGRPRYDEDDEFVRAGARVLE